jgi:hypothetical protein
MDYALLVEDIKSAIAPYCRLLFSPTVQLLVQDASGGAQTHFGGAQYTFWASSIQFSFFFFFFFFSILSCCSKSGAQLQQDVAKFGYKKNRETKSLGIL